MLGFVKRTVILVVAIGAVATPASTHAQNQEKDAARHQAMVKMIEEIHHQLVTLPYYDVFDWLEGEVDDEGTVTLRGQVVRPSTKTEAERRVKRIRGVEIVKNEIEVLPVSPNDDRIRLRVYRTLFSQNSPLFRYALRVVPSIHIIVKNGRVTLKGVVDSEGDSRLAYIRARGVSGVFEVKNELRAAKPDE